MLLVQLLLFLHSVFVELSLSNVSALLLNSFLVRLVPFVLDFNHSNDIFEIVCLWPWHFILIHDSRRRLWILSLQERHCFFPLDLYISRCCVSSSIRMSFRWSRCSSLLTLSCKIYTHTHTKKRMWFRFNHPFICVFKQDWIKFKMIHRSIIACFGHRVKRRHSLSRCLDDESWTTDVSD